MFGRVILIVIMAMSFAPAVQAAEGIDCVYEGLTLTERQRIPTLLEPGPELEALLQRQLDVCTASHGWSADATQLAQLITIFHFLEDEIRTETRLSRHQIDALYLAYEASTPEERDANIGPLLAAMIQRTRRPSYTPEQRTFFDRLGRSAGIAQNNGSGMSGDELLVMRYTRERLALIFNEM